MVGARIGRRNVSRDRALKCADLFAGAGGFSLAAQRAGFDIRLAVECDKAAASTYRRNLCSGHPNLRLVDTSIRDLSPQSLAAELFGAERCDLILGGPPCQGFSTHRLNDAGVDDERNDLVHVYFEFVQAFTPTAFLMENVPGMLWPRHAAVLKRFYREAEASNYKLLEPVILDARDYGLPQRRKRVFILGLRSDLDLGDFCWPPKATHGSPSQRLKNNRLADWVSCKDAFLPAPAGDINDVHMSHGEALTEAFRKTPPNGGSRSDSGRTLPCHAKHDGHKDVYGRIDPDRPAPTMTTACVNPSKGRFVHPTLHHGITVRQAARIQTFPDTFVFEGGLLAAGRQVGNAVPVALGQILLEHLKPLLLRTSESSQGREKSLPSSAIEDIAA